MEKYQQNKTKATEDESQQEKNSQGCYKLQKCWKIVQQQVVEDQNSPILAHITHMCSELSREDFVVLSFFSGSFGGPVADVARGGHIFPFDVRVHWIQNTQ